MRAPVVVLGVAALVASTPAAAYCRKTTSGNPNPSYDPSTTGQCGDGPHALPLYWPSPCIELRVTVEQELVDRGAMTLPRARDIVQRAITAWERADCGAGARPRFRLIDVDGGRCADATAATENEVRFTTLPQVGQELAITDVTMGPSTGRIQGASTRVFDLYATLGGGTIEHLDPKIEYVVRHELGHFLGLAHSEQTSALMYANYPNPSGEAPSSDLTDDDVHAICDAYNPAAPIGAGCSASSSGDTGGAGLGLVSVALGLAARRRRRLVSAALALGLLAISAPARGEEEEESIPTVSVDALPKATPRGGRAHVRRVKKPKKATRTTIAASVRTTPSPALAPTPPPVAVAPAAETPPPMPEPAAPPATAPEPARDAPAATAALAPRSSDVYLGCRYRAFVLPHAVLSLFAEGGGTLVFQSIAIELDVRKRSGLSVVPALSFADLSTGDLLLGNRGDDRVSSFSYVRSDLRAVAGSVELSWSFPLSRTIDFELGFELGVGFTFGTFVDNWVYETPGGPLSFGGRRFAPCQTVNDGVGCRPQDHASPLPIKVGAATETSMLGGGKFPTLVPWVSLPLLGVRADLGEVALRIGVGASATGLWAGVSAGHIISRRD